MSVRHNWLVCKLHTAPIVDKKALPSSREELQFNLMSKIWKSIGTRALLICTSRSLSIPPELFWEQSTKGNNSCESSTCRPIWSAITLGRMLTGRITSPGVCLPSPLNPMSGVTLRVRVFSSNPRSWYAVRKMILLETLSTSILFTKQFAMVRGQLECHGGELISSLAPWLWSLFRRYLEVGV